MCTRHKSPATSSFHFSISDIVNTLYFKPKIHYTLRKCILLRARAVCLCACVSVCMCACAARPQSLQTVGGNDHRLHTLKPTDSSPRSISTFPFLFSLPPTEHLEGPQTPLPSSIYKKPLSPTSIPSSIHLPPFS